MENSDANAAVVKAYLAPDTEDPTDVMRRCLSLRKVYIEAQKQFDEARQTLDNLRMEKDRAEHEFQSARRKWIELVDVRPAPL